MVTFEYYSSKMSKTCEKCRRKPAVGEKVLVSEHRTAWGHYAREYVCIHCLADAVYSVLINNSQPKRPDSKLNLLIPVPETL